MENKREFNLNLKMIIILLVSILITSILFLTLGIHKGNFEYAMSLRIPKLIAIILTGVLIAFSTVLFQTTTNNRLLTPNIMGLDSLYVLIQTVIVFLLGSGSIFSSNKKLNFVICVILMVSTSFVIYTTIFRKGKSNILLIVLIGIILGTLFSSLSKFMQIAIDPNEYVSLQSKLFASFNNVNDDVLVISLIMIFIIFILIFKDIKYLDVMSLGREHAINLGIDYDILIKKFFIVISVFTSISTALVGPITFLGLLVANITKQVVKTYKHFYIITICMLISVFVLILGQFMLERVLKIETPVSVVINLIGGIYFMYLLLKEGKSC